ncbi:ADP-ribosylglycohydrolase-domain-containing protein [Mycena crocata]|nr:ADP-ribosylglycohydrolase-domain-containing protein [Mycena crocata]
MAVRCCACTSRMASNPYHASFLPHPIKTLLGCQHLLTMATPLHAQTVVPAAPASKIRLAVLATAMCDALGGPAEFHRRFSFDFIAHMTPNDNFSLPAGVWTDDTSMALALSRSIATFPFDYANPPPGPPVLGGFNDADQLDAYYRWWQEGELSATGHCFDIGTTSQRALSLYRDALTAAGAPSTSSSTLRRIGATLTPNLTKAKEREKRRAAATVALGRIGRELKGSVFGGNGSLMRVLPVGLAYWKDEKEAAAYAWRSSCTTHPNPVCGEACAVWTSCIARIVQSARSGEGERRMTKLDVLHHFASHSYSANALKSALAADVPLPADAVDDPAAMEAHYAQHHRLMRLWAECVKKAPDTAGASGEDALAAQILGLLPMAEALPSSGYVVHTLAAALYAFLVSTTFEGGALLTANMGDDADTVAAVYGGLAGVWYAPNDLIGEAAEENALFWSPLVREWRAALVKRELVEAVAQELSMFAERQNGL